MVLQTQALFRVQTGKSDPTASPKHPEACDPPHFCEDPAPVGGPSLGGGRRPDRSTHLGAEQKPQILHRRNQPALDLLSPHPPAPVLLGPVMVEGIGKAALHNVLPALAAVARRWTVGLRTGRGHQQRLHLPSNRPSPLGLDRKSVV